VLRTASTSCSRPSSRGIFGAHRYRACSAVGAKRDAPLRVLPGGGANHSGISYFNNQISSLNNLMSFGLMVGSHPWNNTVNLVSAGSVSGNTVSGAVINLQIEADTTGTASGQVIVGTGLSGAQGNWTYQNGTTCSISTNYAVNPAHAGRISFDAGYFPLLYDNGSCTPQ